MKLSKGSLSYQWKQKNWLLYNPWGWHLIFWLGYCSFRFSSYYLAVQLNSKAFLEYMVLSDIMFAAITYYTVWLYILFFRSQKYITYFLIGALSWILYLYGCTHFKLYYLRNETRFNDQLIDSIFSNLPFILLCFLFITACKYFKDEYISHRLETEKKRTALIGRSK